MCVWGGGCQLQTCEFAHGEGQIESNRLSQHTAVWRDPIWNVACGSKIYTHARVICLRYIKSEEEQHVFQLIFWPAQSADLNPIELMWGKVRANQATSEGHLWQLLEESWVELSSVYLLSLVNGMPRIREAVIVAKGGYFDESKV